MFIHDQNVVNALFEKYILKTASLSVVRMSGESIPCSWSCVRELGHVISRPVIHVNDFRSTQLNIIINHITSQGLAELRVGEGVIRG